MPGNGGALLLAYGLSKARRSSQQLEITKIDCNHNHEVSKEIFQLYPENRRLTRDEKEYVLPLLDLNVLPNVVAGKLAEKTGKVVTTMDLHNVRRNPHGQDEAELLVQEIEKCRQQHRAKIIPITDENEELQILFIQTPHMQQAYKSFPEVVLLDATYRTNKLKMPLFVFVVQDGCGESQVIAYAFVASEQCHHVTEMLNLFVKENPCSDNTGVIVVDKDFSEISAIRSAFPSAPSIQLCQFHVIKAFRTAASHLACSSEEREKMVTTFNEMLHAPNASKFEEAQSEFTRFASKESIEYLEKNWLSIKNMWVRHICDQEFTCGANTTNRVEAHNGFIKTALSSSTKLHDALRKLLDISSSIERKSAHSATLLKTCIFYNHSSNNKVEDALLLTGIAGQEAAARVLNEEGVLDESDIEVRPEELPSALLDHRVPLTKLKKYFTAEAWLLLSSSIAVKKKGDIWCCAQCKKKDDGEIKMILCDRCLEWFHWPCVSVKKEDLKRHWFCLNCCAHT
ncbi:hypothetical protein HPB50_017749 [Hyalomma asiaticum]|uniref:Uncharacterized protein n=1 Tax=Hyalomma asiaticum TaxID=266040 RepID=A0ACB7SZP7_HYAAI|nr:hypothetical protein HPB50_017749 [Hyalomma asiaticum]